MGVKEIYHRGPARGVRARLRLPHVPRQHRYEGEYLLGTSIARPLIAKRLVEIATETGADAISHGATGKGNDQVRFELGAYALKPDVQVIAPWREWDLNSRETLMAYAEAARYPGRLRQAGQEVALFHGCQLPAYFLRRRLLEDPWDEPEEDMWRWSVAPEKAPDAPTYIELSYKKGDIVAIDGKDVTPGQVMEQLNKLGGDNGIGRDDIVENRYVGMKSRGCYETPGRHHHAQGPPRHGVPDPGPRGDASQR